MRKQAALGERHVCEQPWRELHRLYLALVREVKPDKGTVGVELVDGSQPLQAAVMSANANSTSGLVWLPQVGDMVVVGFAQGHKSMPIVLGSVYATNDTLHEQEANSFTIKHQSGSSLEIDADGTILVTQQAGAFLKLKPSGDVEMKHATNAGDITLDASGATVSQGGVKAVVNATHILLDAGGGGKIEILPGGTVNILGGTGGINITPAGGQNVTIAGGSSNVMRAGDQTSSPIGGGVPDHYHLLIGGSTKVFSG